MRSLSYSAWTAGWLWRGETIDEDPRRHGSWSLPYLLISFTGHDDDDDDDDDTLRPSGFPAASSYRKHYLLSFTYMS
jgi:hypothetical protein